MYGLGNSLLYPPVLDVGHRKMMHRLWTNQELWSNLLLHHQQDLWEESLVKCRDNKSHELTNQPTIHNKTIGVWFCVSYQGHCWSVTHLSSVALPPLGL